MIKLIKKLSGKKEQLSVFDDISKTKSPLSNTQSLMKCVLKSECKNWFNKEDLFTKLKEELDELRAEADSEIVDREKAKSEIGDVLIIINQIAMFYDIDTEDALRTTNERIEKRFRHVETGLINEGKTFYTGSQDEIGKYWKEAKLLEKQQAND